LNQVSKLTADATSEMLKHDEDYQGVFMAEAQLNQTTAPKLIPLTERLERVKPKPAQSAAKPAQTAVPAVRKPDPNTQREMRRLENEVKTRLAQAEARARTLEKTAQAQVQVQEKTITELQTKGTVKPANAHGLANNLKDVAGSYNKNFQESAVRIQNTGYIAASYRDAIHDYAIASDIDA
jgi:hypothetical protein